MTQREVAECIGVKLRHYQNVEAGESFLTQDKLNTLEDLFELPQRVLLAKNVKEIPDYYEYYISFLSTENC